MTDNTTRGESFVSHILDDYELSSHAEELLKQAGRIIDTIDELEEALEGEPRMISTSQGMRVHPLIVEARAQRAALLRLLSSLDLPLDDDEV